MLARWGLGIWLLAAPIHQAPAQAAPPAADSVELVRLETVWNQAHMRGDAEALDALWADELVVTVPNMPVMAKAEALAFSRSGRMRFERYATSDLHVQVFGDAAMVTGRLQRTREMEGRAVEDDWRFTKTYIRRAGRWLVVAFHASERAP